MRRATENDFEDLLSALLAGLTVELVPTPSGDWIARLIGNGGERLLEVSVEAGQTVRLVREGAVEMPPSGD